MSESKQMWAVMKALTWDSIDVQGHPLHAPKEGPHRFIPLFDSKEAALVWNDGIEDNIQELIIGVKKE